MNDVNPISPIAVPYIIKVTTGDPLHSYFVHFDRNTHALLNVCEYKPIYTPIMGPTKGKIKDIADTARMQLTIHLETPEATGAKQ